MREQAISEGQKGYLAGFLDGDGTITREGYKLAMVHLNQRGPISA